MFLKASSAFLPAKFCGADWAPAGACPCAAGADWDCVGAAVDSAEAATVNVKTSDCAKTQMPFSDFLFMDRSLKLLV